MKAGFSPVPVPKRVLTAMLMAVLLLGLIACDDEDSNDPAPTPEPEPIAEEDIGERDPVRGKDQVGGDGVEALSDEEKIRLVVEAFFTSSEPLEVCEQAVTDRFLRRAYGDLAGCQTAQGQGGAADEVAIENVTVSGDEGGAIARPEGGPADGETITVALERDDKAWRISELTSDVPVGP